MNDPLAMMYMPDQTGEVWGIACVDAYGELILRNQRGSILLCKHVITNKVVEVFEKSRYKTSVNLNMDANVCAGFEFENIVGIHTVTVVWVTPQLYMHQISEHELASYKPSVTGSVTPKVTTSSNIDLIKNKDIPPEESGYVPPKKGPTWDKDKKGWTDKKGNVWVPAPVGAKHGGEHWDVQYPNGGYDNVFPDGVVLPGKGPRGSFSPMVVDDNWVKAGLIIGGIAIIVGTIGEDIFTGGVGIADDPVTLTAGAAMITQALAH